MKVLHVVTWDAPGNPFGGPLTVARNLATGLTEAGHEVTVIAARPASTVGAAASHMAAGSPRFRGYRLIPGAGFSGLFSPRLLWWVFRHVRSFDVVHVHVCRDLVTLPAAFLAQLRRVKVVLQPHGMVDPSQKRSARILDQILTRRVFARAHGVLSLTENERRDITTATGVKPEAITMLENGVPYAEPRTPIEADSPEFIFCSRLHRRKNPAMFAEVARLLLADGEDARFTIVGTDEGEQHAVDQIIAEAHDPRLRRETALPPEEVISRLRTSDVLVLPSVNEPYPMIVLEAMSLGLPVIVADTCGLADFVKKNQAGMVVQSGDAGSLLAAMRELLRQPDQRVIHGNNARHAVREHLDLGSVTRRLIRIYEATTSRPSSGHHLFNEGGEAVHHVFQGVAIEHRGLDRSTREKPL